MRWRWALPRAGRERRLGLLLVGFGVRGRQWARVVARRPDLELIGVVDPAAEARRAAATGRLRTWPSLDEALAAGSPEAALVASPSAAHAEQAIRCLERGVGVLVEKPLATSLGDAWRVSAAAARDGRPALVGQSFRFLPRSRAVDRALAAGWIGAPRSAVVVVTRPAHARPASLESLEHAPLWDFAVHHLDLVRLRFGALPRRVAATYRPAAGADDPRGGTYALELEWESGGAVVYRQCEQASFFHHHEWIEGERGGLCVEDGRVTLVTTRHRPRRVRVWGGPTPEHALLDALVGAARGAGESPLGAHDNLGTVAMIEAAVVSLRHRRPTSLAEVAAAAGVPLGGPATGDAPA